MEVEKKKIELEKKDNEIIFSKSIKAGKRIYYLDVKKSRNDDLFLAITESKKRVPGKDDDIQVSYEKHKIFLYKEDFDHFTEGLEEVIKFIKKDLLRLVLINLLVSCVTIRLIILYTEVSHGS